MRTLARRSAAVFLRGEAGMSMAEVMIAMLILAGGALAVLNLIGAQAHSSYRNEQSQVITDRLQQEMEKIKQLPYNQIALTGVPADSTDTNNPAWRVQGTSFATTQDGGNVRSLVYNGSGLVGGGTVSGGTVDPTPTHFSSGDVSGTIHRYVVWEDDPSCSESDCPGDQDLKRVIVAIEFDSTAAGGVRHYQELQSEITDPASRPVSDSNPVSGRNASGYPWTFWLTDTSCDNGSRQAITADHLTHNTRGVCSTGVQNGNNPGAPDLMLNQAAPLTGETPLFDYATDVEPSQNPTQDKGLQLVTGSGNNCDSQALTVAFAPETDQPARYQQLHTWLSKPMPSGTSLALNGTGTLNLWTQTVGGATYAGQICVWLFIQTTDGSGNVSRTTAVNQTAPLTGASYFTSQQTPWPTGWTELHIQLTFNLTQQLTDGARIGLALEVDPNGTSSDGLQFLYDEPSFDSRLELRTPSSPPTL